MTAASVDVGPRAEGTSRASAVTWTSVLARTAARGARRDERGRAVVLDLSDVAWMDSTGLRLLDDLTRTFEARGAAVRIVAPADVPARFTLDLSAWRPDSSSDV